MCASGARGRGQVGGRGMQRPPRTVVCNGGVRGWRSRLRLLLLRCTRGWRRHESAVHGDPCRGGACVGLTVVVFAAPRGSA